MSSRCDLPPTVQRFLFTMLDPFTPVAGPHRSMVTIAVDYGCWPIYFLEINLYCISLAEKETKPGLQFLVGRLVIQDSLNHPTILLRLVFSNKGTEIHTFGKCYLNIEEFSSSTMKKWVILYLCSPSCSRLPPYYARIQIVVLGGRGVGKSTLVE
ncbi:hypothetical protein NPIL_391631 [Nephila pilipes]|uniref:Uncharacterized protein n=1 Tax=Nephila pilipes TaxID=299642 RepID=A0A8X6NBK3_NEPPI|nr:hypothetical protein NPIL_391631 [Nephila pilipes]